MPTLVEGNLSFNFGPNLTIWPYEKSRHYQTQWSATRGRKVVDFVVAPRTRGKTGAWLIEVKDFRVIGGPPGAKNIAGLPKLVVQKAVDSWNGLADAAANALDSGEKSTAILFSSATMPRIVLHLEPHQGKHSRLFPRNFRASVLQGLRRLVLDMEPPFRNTAPLVLSIADTRRAAVPWTVS